MRPWTLEEHARWDAHRQAVIEAAADHDDEVLDAFLDARAVPVKALRRGLRVGTLAGALVPVLAGSAFKKKGSTE